jgi:hypothetical protein
VFGLVQSIHKISATDYALSPAFDGMARATPPKGYAMCAGGGQIKQGPSVPSLFQTFQFNAFRFEHSRFNRSLAAVDAGPCRHRNRFSLLECQLAGYLERGVVHVDR